MQPDSGKSVTSFKQTALLSVSYSFQNHERFVRRVEYTIFEERTLFDYLSVGIEHETGIWKSSNNAHSKYLVPRAVKIELSHNAMEVILAPLYESSPLWIQLRECEGIDITVSSNTGRTAEDIREKQTWPVWCMVAKQQGNAAVILGEEKHER